MKYLYPVMPVALLSCNSKEEEENKPLAKKNSHDIIKGEIWDKSCISCHVADASFARQSDLILTSDRSYDQLVGRVPANAAATEDGLLLVGTNGLESLYNSFLWEKINAPNEAHFCEDHPEYGSLIPLGGDYLTYGEIAFIREWIENGAPGSGDIADRTLLQKTERFERKTFEALAPPEKGFQMQVAPFEVQAGQERELFIYKELGNSTPAYINRVQITMRNGSHHFILYNFPRTFPTEAYPEPGDIRDVYTSSGSYNTRTLYHMQFHQFVAVTQWPNLDYTFPEGVALKVPANSGFDLNSHYANKTDQLITGEVFANIHTIDSAEVEHEADILNLNNLNIYLPTGETTTLKKSYGFTEDIHIFQLWSYAHEHMTAFRVYMEGGERDGELLYVSFDWEHPPILQTDPPIHVKVGEKLRLEATYYNDEEKDLTFGLRSTEEMIILFGAYYK